MALIVGLLGGGAVAGPHLAGYAAIGEVAAVKVAETSPEARERVRGRPKVTEVADDPRRLIDDPAIDLIDICLPHHLHAEFAVPALEAGKAVICEKPIARTLEEADAMIAASERTGRPLYIAHNQRFYPHHVRAKELLDSGAIGKPFLAIFNIIGNEFARMNDPASWKGTWDKAGGGAYIDTGFHATYMLHHFFGQPTAVTAVMKRLVVEPKGKADDNAAVIFEFPGVLANLANTYTALHHPWDERRGIYGTEGSLHCNELVSPRLRLVKNHQATAIEVDEPASIWEYSIAAAVAHFVDCFINGAAPLVTPQQSRSALRTALAAYQSAREGRRVEL